MASELARRMIAEAIPSVVAPVARVYVDHRFGKRDMERMYSHQIEMAEKKAEMMRNAFGMDEEQQEEEPAVPRLKRPERSPERIYSELRSFRDGTECSFCHELADSFLESDLDTASRGLSELRQYQEIVQRAKVGELAPEEVESVITDKAQNEWTAIPMVMMDV